MRLAVAKSLLRQNGLSVMQICLEVGYQDPSHFAKVFKRREGVPPHRIPQADHGGQRVKAKAIA